MSTRQFQIGALAVVALVALRLALGCHFLYEGVWKIAHRDEFSVEPFLTTAKGPLAGLFYAMVPDINGRHRLRVVTEAGKKRIPSDEIAARWDRIRAEYVDFYRPPRSDAEAAASYKDLEREAERIGKEYIARLDEYLADNVDDIAAYFDSLDRFENDKERGHEAPFNKQRRWNRMMELRWEAAGWIKGIKDQERALENALFSLLNKDQKEVGRPPASWNPFRWTRVEQLNFAVTYGLTAIGLCLILGLLTPLAALGGAAFMCFVVASQPAFPGIYPPDNPLLGHALLINKDFIEMLALLVIACVPAGRWGGLDFFLHRWFAARCRRKERKQCYAREKPSGDEM